MKIDVDAVLRDRLPRHYRFIPRPLVRWVERTICQEQMNEMLRINHGLRDADFCRGVLSHLGITWSARGCVDRLAATPRPLIVSNHPLGGLDGIVMIDFITRTCGPGMRFLVNDLLMAIEPLSGVFLPVNKHGAQSRAASAAIDEAMASSAPLVIFPAGLVSRRRNGHVADLTWQKMFVNKAIASGRPVIPVHFSGHNSSFFYTFANLRERLGLKFNIEMVFLPREVFRAAGSAFTISVGAPVPPSELRGGAAAAATAADIRRRVYALA
ncbi:MAG: acyltransferase [Bacteroides sp.]|nr:acyltransferase [Bacteroides sp.]